MTYNLNLGTEITHVGKIHPIPEAAEDVRSRGGRLQKAAA